ncbi:MAG TPA: hypothetical protein VFG64_04895 [Dongiaceae bacterium]|nr:hypothetical protein [Dongiaceae bacterium]
MSRIDKLTRSKAGIAAALLAAALLAGCTTPPPPRPAMVPLGQTGDFGYSEHDLGQDRIAVTYTGATIPVPSRAGRDNARVQAELAKIHDLALWRAAQIADQRGMAAMKIENETRDTDLQVTQQYVQRVSPFYDPFWHHRRYCCGPSWFYDDPYPYYYQPVRRADAQAVTTLTIQLLRQYDPHDATQLSVKETLTRLQTARAGAVY